MVKGSTSLSFAEAERWATVCFLIVHVKELAPCAPNMLPVQCRHYDVTFVRLAEPPPVAIAYRRNDERLLQRAVSQVR